MDYKLLVNIYDSLSEKLEKLLKNPEFNSYLKNNTSLLDATINQISILLFIEKKLNETKKNEKKKKSKKSSLENDICFENMNNSKKLFDVLKGIEPTVIKLKDLSFEKIEDINDSINYLNIVFKNAFNKDLESFLVVNTQVQGETFQDQNTKESVEAEKVNPNEFNNNQQGSNSFNGNAGFQNTSNFGGGFGGFGPDVSPESFKETYLYTIASQRLQQDILSGTFYKFKTKPKSILIIKKILGVLFWLIALVGVISLIVSWMLVNLKIELKSTDSNGSPTIYYPFNANSNVFGTLFSILYIFIYSYIGALLFKDYKNENKKYDFQKLILLIFTIFFVFQLITFIQEIVGSFGVIHKLETEYAHLNSTFLINSYKTFVYIGIVQTVMYGIIVIFVILAMYYAPKIDSERMNLKIKQYVDEMRPKV